MAGARRARPGGRGWCSAPRLLFGAGARPARRWRPSFWSALVLFTVAGCLMALNGIAANTHAPDPGARPPARPGDGVLLVRRARAGAVRLASGGLDRRALRGADGDRERGIVCLVVAAVVAWRMWETRGRRRERRADAGAGDPAGGGSSSRATLGDSSGERSLTHRPRPLARSRCSPAPRPSALPRSAPHLSPCSSPSPASTAPAARRSPGGWPTALGWRVVDNELVEQVAARAGLPPEDVAEREERVPTFVERLARTLAAATPEVFPPPRLGRRRGRARRGRPGADHRDAWWRRSRRRGGWCWWGAPAPAVLAREARRAAREAGGAPRLPDPGGRRAARLRPRRGRADRARRHRRDAGAVPPRVLPARLGRPGQLSHGAQHRRAGVRRGDGGGGREGEASGW